MSLMILNMVTELILETTFFYEFPIPVFYIRITFPCDLYPRTPHFYIVKLGCTGVYIFHIFCSKTWIMGTY